MLRERPSQCAAPSNGVRTQQSQSVGWIAKNSKAIFNQNAKGNFLPKTDLMNDNSDNSMIRAILRILILILSGDIVSFQPISNDKIPKIPKKKLVITRKPTPSHDRLTFPIGGTMVTLQ